MGYDAEGSYSPDGNKILFASNREAYTRSLSKVEQALLDDDASYFMDLYVMDADGSNVQQLTFSPGYDGGPFYNKEGTKILWRRFNPDGNSAEIWTADSDGSNQRQLTANAMVNWGPYFHPSGDYIIYSSNLLGHANFELFMIDPEGLNDPVRVTNTQGTDILPVFSPDGNRLAWSTTRTPGGASQIHMADWDHQLALELLGLD
jgi:Tol biopolymer transport system component